jgi:hypothetical protein
MMKLHPVTLVWALVLGFTDQACFADPSACSSYFPKAKKESYYPCMWQVNNVVDLFGYSNKIYSACFPKKDADGKVVGHRIYPSAVGVDGGASYFTETKIVGPDSDMRQKSNGRKIMMIETAKDGEGQEYLRVIDVASNPQRVVALTKKGCLLHSFNLIDADQKGHAVSGETCKAIIDARQGKNPSEGEATRIARENTTTEASMKSALKNCGHYTTIGVLARRNPSAIKSSERSSGGANGGSSKKAK